MLMSFIYRLYIFSLFRIQHTIIFNNKVSPPYRSFIAFMLIEADKSLETPENKAFFLGKNKFI